MPSRRPARSSRRWSTGVAAIVERAGAAARVLVSSFHPRAVRLWMRRLPAVPAGLLFEREAPLPLRRAWAAPLLRPFALHPEMVLCSAGARERLAPPRLHGERLDGRRSGGARARAGAWAWTRIITNDPAAPARAAGKRPTPATPQRRRGTGRRRSSGRCRGPSRCCAARNACQLRERHLVHGDVLGVVAAARADAREAPGVEERDRPRR